MSKRIASVSLHIFARSSHPAVFKARSRPSYSLPTFCYTDHTLSHPRSRKQLRSTTTFTSVAVLVLTACLLSAGSLYLSPSSSQDQPEVISVTVSTHPGLNSIMVGPVLPGRPGNLTPEQELKLQELWTATLRVFGVQAPEDAEYQHPGSGTATPDKNVKKKKHSMFKKSKDEDDDKASTDQNDKYGQSKEFQQVLATQDPEKLRSAFWSMVKHDHPDGLLLRFLRARKWNVHNALVMLIATMNWRLKDIRVDDDIMKRGEGQAVSDSLSTNAAVQKEGKDFLAQLRLGKSFLHGVDKEGRPMCFVRVRLHRQGEQSETSLERYTVYTIETARLLLAPEVDTAAIVFDMTGFSLANMDYAPVKFMIKCFEANYPESLGVVLVHKSPWIFQSIWNIIKGWLDPVVASKVHFTKNLEELERFVDKSHIIKELGGDDPWEYQYVEPRTGENERMVDESSLQRLVDERSSIVKEYENTTQEWITNSENRKVLQQKRNDLAERLRSGYWQLDPYVRARSLYDRTGMIREGGLIQYYGEPETVNGPKPLVASSQSGPRPVEPRADDVD